MHNTQTSSFSVGDVLKIHDNSYKHIKKVENNNYYYDEYWDESLLKYKKTESGIIEKAIKIGSFENETFGSYQHFKTQFNQYIDSFFADENVNHAPIVVCPTSNALKLAKANGKLDITINYATLKNCVTEPEKAYHGHSLSKEIIKGLPDLVQNSIFILKGSMDNSIVCVSEYQDNNGDTIIAALELNAKLGFADVNRVKPLCLSIIKLR